MKDITITCMCDNNVKLSSRLRGEHGIAFLVEQGKKSILFDSGQSYDVLSHNAGVLDKDLSNLDGIVLSHGHYDHTGGLRGVSRASQAPIYAHPSIFEDKYKAPQGSEPSYIGIPFTRTDIEASSRFHLSAEHRSVEGLVTATGEVPRITPSEEVPDIFLKKTDSVFVKDDILDDQSLVVDNGEEAYIILGCNHAGMINTITHCKTLATSPITMVFGGTHLVAATGARMADTISYLKAEGISMHGYHCTGDRASFELKSAMGDAYEKGIVGTEYIL